MFEIIPGRYFIAFWYFDFPVETAEFPAIGPFGKGGNFNALVWREGDNGHGEKVNWHLKYRFRYYRDGRIHDHQDRMEWFGGDVQGCSEDEIEESTSSWVKSCCATVHAIYDFFPIRGDHLEYWRRARAAPPAWMHMDLVLAERIDTMLRESAAR